MNKDVLSDLTSSASDFKRVVWPELSKEIEGGQLLPMETITDSNFAKQFDFLSGIDAWQIHPQYGIRGIASRVQWLDTTTAWYRCHGPYNTFTIRYSRDNGTKTEYAKRCDSILQHNKQGWQFPHLTVQAFIALPIGSGMLLSCAVVRTKALFQFLAEKEKDKFIDPTGRRCYGLKHNSNATFVYVRWDSLPSNVIRIIDHTKDGRKVE